MYYYYILYHEYLYINIQLYFISLFSRCKTFGNLYEVYQPAS